MTAPDEARTPFCLADEERTELHDLWFQVRARRIGSNEFLAHVTDLCDAYRAQGYVMGDLAHDGTLRAQGEAE